MIDISIVTGTYNRLAYLQQMILSAREALTPALTHEFIVVDGGSTDGTQTWCHDQPDILLIEHGALYGGLRAFGDGARAAQGRFVILANDDIQFHPYSIVRAWVHLMRTPHCGQVAFADNRAAPGYGTDFHVQSLSVQVGDQIKSLPYAQVSMTRRDLGAEIGWWGDQHPVMGQGHTYGGDNFLSAGVYERGYSVDPVEGAAVNDLVIDDLLRDMNRQAEIAKPAAYYNVYPSPPFYGSRGHAPDVTANEGLRVLLFTLYEPGYGQYKSGLRLALQEVGKVWEVDYLNEPYDLSAMVAAWQPHLLLLQLHSAEQVTHEMIAAARSWCPSMVVVNWNGDVYEDKLTSPPMIRLLQQVDIQLTVNAAVIPVYQRHNIRAAYWQVAFEPVDELPRVAGHDVVWLANCYSPERRRLGDMLRALGVNVGLYGSGWRVANGNTTYNFSAGAALYRKAKVAIGDNQYPDQHGFVSNRIFEALANGACLLHEHVPGLEELTGLRAWVHYVEWKDQDELQALIRYYLSPRHAADRNRIAAAGEAFVQQQHSFTARVHELFSRILPEVLSESQPT